MRIILTLTLFLIISCKSTFDIRLIHDENIRETTVYLFKNNIKIDSLNISDYYGKNKIVRLEDNLWSIEYSTRCGTGCITRNVILINEYNQTINVPYHTFKEYKDSVFNKLLFIDKENNGDLTIQLEMNINSKKIVSDKQKLVYDDSSHIYYNHLFNYDDKSLKGIKLDSFEFIFLDKKWAEFSSKNNQVFYEF